jgi:hypothetical protein
MTSTARIWSVINSVSYVSKRNLPGAIVECGVWRGGSMMAAAKEAIRYGSNRDLYLFDTFEGMSEPTADDTHRNQPVFDEWKSYERDGGSDWCFASIDDVRKNMFSTNYPANRIRLVKGKVEDTLRDAANLPDQIAVLRLDTDWYESTKVELEVLYPRLVAGGVLIIDDFGYWDGARKAVTEYFDRHDVRPLLFNYVDSTGRIAVKV